MAVSGSAGTSTLAAAGRNPGHEVVLFRVSLYSFKSRCERTGYWAYELDASSVRAATIEQPEIGDEDTAISAE
ncbi:hypothetical protein N0V93_002362 [Gnomoniopsis smithogilvyi]|uniref:Uncharacterized protein n=1 Tax=Gnomoniopsis smithogilvyi TaxID=1191159 RepID=A0A9W8YYN1_9PEZI|nr:hypothetical protein N0V93_002362 [Gnomoniopsis smithogilvyi]